MFYFAARSRSRSGSTTRAPAPRSASALAAIVISALLLAACGGGSGSVPRTTAGVPTSSVTGVVGSTGDSSPVSTPVSPPVSTTLSPPVSTPVAPALSAEAGLADASARVAAFAVGPTTIGPVESLTAVPPGRVVAYLQCPSPNCAEVAAGVKNAARAIGARALIVPYQANRVSVDAALAEVAAVVSAAGQPSMVLTGSLPRSWLAGALPGFAATGVPVIAWELPEGTGGDGIAANLVTGDDLWFRGVLLADQVVAATGGRARVVVWRLGDLVGSAGSALVADGLRDEVARVCPDCSVDVRTYTVAQAQQGEHLVDLVEASSSGPTVDAVVSLQADLVLGGPNSLDLVLANLPRDTAVSASASPVRILTIDGSTEVYRLLTKGRQTADLATPRAFLGWRAVDAGLRILAGRSPLAPRTAAVIAFPGHPDIGAYGVPLQLLTAASFTKAASPRQSPWKSWSGVQGFDGLFRTLWGLGS